LSVDRDICHLHPELAYRGAKLEVAMVALGHPVWLYEGLRAFERQNELWAMGRTVAGVPCTHQGEQVGIGECHEHPWGLPVTNAPAGKSKHNAAHFGMSLAGDWIFEGASPWAPGHPWELLGQIGESLGLKWGGRWPSRDYAHLEWDEHA
jgi:hypothetical protein